MERIDLKKTLSLFTVIIFIAAFRGHAWAVQAHGGSEGLVSHQVGHILFIFGMGYLLFRIYRMRTSGTGWPEFKTFLFLIISWNILTFTGHWMREYADPARFIMTGREVKAYEIKGIFDMVFYFSRLDHLLLVPAFVFLLLSLRKWRQG